MVRKVPLLLTMVCLVRAVIGAAQPCENWSLSITTDANPGQTSWQIRDVSNSQVIASGGGYTNHGTITLSICLPTNGYYSLVMNDSGGNGITGGGWVLRDPLGRRVLDNTGNGGNFSSTCAPPEPFCTVVGNTKLLDTHCDVETWLPTSVVVCNEDPLVSAQWQVGDQTNDGYQFWFFDPIGAYTRKVFRSHAASGGLGPPDATRACRLDLGTIITDPLPTGTLLNVRIRSRVNGLNSAWGGACRFRLDPVAAQCPPARLVDYAGPLLSCGTIGRHVNGTDRLYARPVTRLVNGNTQVADQYQFEFSLPSENYSHVAANTSAWVTLAPWTVGPLLCGPVTYNVRVRASFNGGNSWCPWGAPCPVLIINNSPPLCGPSEGNRHADATDPEYVHALLIWPNPSNGDQLFITIADLGEEVPTASIEVIDVFGKRVMNELVSVDGSALNTVLDLKNGLSEGLYVVNITASGSTFTERLVIAK